MTDAFQMQLPQPSIPTHPMHEHDQQAETGAIALSEAHAILPFNETMPVLRPGILQPPEDVVRNTLGLWCASPEDAVKFGGELTRNALSYIPITNTRKYVVVDVKVHMLMPGQCPAIPGWHVDGTPRHRDGSPAGGGLPDFHMQLDPPFRPPIYHLLVTGEHCLTEFLRERMPLRVPSSMMRSPSMFAHVSAEVKDRVAAAQLSPFSLPSCWVATFDWWALHQGVIASGHEWRYLIRVAETDTLPPQQDLRNVIRTQQNVYSPLDFGW